MGELREPGPREPGPPADGGDPDVRSARLDPLAPESTGGRGSDSGLRSSGLQNGDTGARRQPPAGSRRSGDTTSEGAAGERTGREGAAGKRTDREGAAGERTGGGRTPGGAQPQRSGPRAGRNLAAAFAVGGVLGAAVLVSLLVWRPSFLAVIVAAVTLASWEVVRAVREAGPRPPLPPLLLGGAAMAVAGWFAGLAGLAVATLLTALAILVWRLRGSAVGYQRDTSAGLMIMVYVPFLAGFAAMLAAPSDGHWRMLAMLGLVVLTDTGGYVAGVFLGRHPMAPVISPKKSWEGLAGSLLAAATGGAIGLALLFGVAWWWGAAVGLVIAIAAVFGDLVESMLKRDLGIKDMSGLLPGHGGLMDRLDSILFAAPAAYLLLSVVVG